MRQYDRSTVVDEELHDLKLRFELLGRQICEQNLVLILLITRTLEGDRKAYYETSQWAIRQNKEEVSRLRLQNKELSDAIAKLKKVQPTSCSRERQPNHGYFPVRSRRTK